MSTRKKIIFSIVGVIILVLSFQLVPSIQHRAIQAVDDVKAYYYDNNRATSIGYRLDFWHIALRCFAEGPVFGISYDRRSEIMDEFAKDYPASRHIGNDGRSSSHNEVLNALSKKGIIGLVGILLLYLIPLRFFIGCLGRGVEPGIRHLAMAGVGAVLAMIICGITEAPLMNVRVATTYGFTLVLLYLSIQSLATQRLQR